MTKKELATLLDGREYDNELPDELNKIAAKSGLVVIYGSSDDLMEFGGAMDEEVDIYGGGSVWIDRNEVNPLLAHVAMSEEGEFINTGKNKIEALRHGIPPYAWAYSTSIPHETFDILRRGNKYCRGIVFSVSDLKP